MMSRNDGINDELLIKEILDGFLFKLRKIFDDKILGVYLFGSIAKGTATSESDIDVLIVYDNVDERDLLECISDISFKIVCERGRMIEAVCMSKQEYEQSLGHSPFLWEVLKFGKPIFSILEGTEWELDFNDYMGLAQEYLNYAKDAVKEEKIRLSIDCAYNACELLVKAMIIHTKNPLSSSHGGIVGQFGKLFVLTKKVPENFGRDLNLALELRAKARYKPKALLDLRDAQFVINLTQELIKIAKIA